VLPGDKADVVRKLKEGGHRLGPILVNQVHPDPGPAGAEEGGEPGHALLRFLAERDRRGLELLRSLFPGGQEILPIALERLPPSDLPALIQFSSNLNQIIS
jgi:hypothetical protein